MWAKRWLAVAGVISAAALAGGCSADPDQPFAMYQRVQSEGGGFEMSPLGLSGELVLDDDCLYVRDSQDWHKRWLLVLPEETRWDSEGRTLTLDERVAWVGEQVVLGGHQAHELPEGATVPDACEVPEPASTPGLDPDLAQYEIFVAALILPPEEPSPDTL